MTQIVGSCIHAPWGGMGNEDELQRAGRAGEVSNPIPAETSLRRRRPGRRRKAREEKTKGQRRISFISAASDV